MGWRDLLEAAAEEVDFGTMEYDGPAQLLLAMPAPDRIALARELLAGTNYIATKPPRGMGSRRSFEYAQGWNDCITKLKCGQADETAGRRDDGR